MIQNYLKTAFRQLWRHRGYSLINLLGLAVGMACCLLILLYVYDETSFDRFHPNGDRVYRVALDRSYPENTRHYAIIPSSYAAAMKEEYPEVEEAVRLFYFGENHTRLEIEDRHAIVNHFMWADSNFFQVFGIPLLQGDMKTVLSKPGTVVLTQSVARRLFGDADPVGQTLEIPGGGAGNQLVVSGVCSDAPANTHLRFEVLASSTNLGFLQQPNFIGFSAYTYLLLKPDADPIALEARFPELVRKYATGQIQRQFGIAYDDYVASGNGYHYFLQPLTKIYLNSNLESEMRPPGSQTRVNIFTVIALFILIIAIINFMNLATAKATERAREVGIRKTLGGLRSQLVGQFLTEAVLMTLLAGVLTLALLNGLIPLFNQLSGKAMSWETLLRREFLLALAGLILLVGLLAGTYPAMVLSQFKPIAVLKGKLTGSRHGVVVRNSLVVFQFAISITLIISTIIVVRQMDFIRNKELGFNKEQLITLRNAFVLDQQSIAFREELRKLSGVAQVGSCNAMPGDRYFGFSVHADGAQEPTFGSGLYVDEYYVDCMEMALLDGRNFSQSFNDTLSVIINETAARELGLEKPVGSRLLTRDDALIPEGQESAMLTVVGLLRDYHFQSLHQSITPLFLLLNPNEAGANAFVSVRLKEGNVSETIRTIEEKWKAFVPNQPFEFTFVDRDLDQLYQAELVAQKVFSLFALLAIFIACLGLFGLAAFLTRQRNREIGLRKVLGASTGQIVALLSGSFLRLVLLALLLAVPLAWYAMYRWLESFAYSAGIAWWIFPLAGAMAILVALLTVSAQSIRAALTNPVSTLRGE